MSRPLNVLIIGGGPVGLMTARLLLQQDDKNRFEISVLEKRPEYVRDQVLLVDEMTISLMPDEVVKAIWDDALEGCWVLPPIANSSGTCYRKQVPIWSQTRPRQFAYDGLDHVPTATVSIGTFERHMLDWLRRTYPVPRFVLLRPDSADEPFDIVLRPDSVTLNGKKLAVDVLIGADGAGSQVRSQVLRTDTVPLFANDDMFRMTGVTVIAKMPPYTVPRLDPPSFELTRAKIRESLARPAQGYERWRLFKLPDGTNYFAFLITPRERPYFMKFIRDKDLDSPAAEFLINRMATICRSSGTVDCDRMTIETIATFDVMPQMSRIFSRSDGKFPVYLVGDALATTNFFSGTGMNDGIYMGNFLVNDLVNPEHYDGTDQDLGRIPVDRYRKLMLHWIYDMMSGASRVTFNRLLIDQDPREPEFELERRWGLRPETDEKQTK